MNSIARASIQTLLAVLVVSGASFGQAPAGNAPDSGAQTTDTNVAAVGTASGGTIKAHDASYVIGNDDHLSISVWKEPDLTKNIPVRSDGKISLPLVGEIVDLGA